MRFTNYLKYLIFVALFSCSLISKAQQVPIPEWVKDIGGSGESKVTGIGIDKFDNVYVSGNFQDEIIIDNSGVSTPVKLVSMGEYDIFIAKYSYDGKLLWAKSIGGGGWDQANNLTVDDQGAVYIASFTQSSDMDCDPGPGSHIVSSDGTQDALLVKLSTDGAFLWESKLGGGGLERGHVVTTDKNGDVIFVGGFETPQINIGPFVLYNKAGLDGFMVKYDRNGTILFAKTIGSLAEDEVRCVKTNSNNEIVINGYFNQDIDLNPGGPAYILTSNVTANFVAKYSPAGDLIWANKIEGESTLATFLTIGPTDNIYVTGKYTAESPANVSFISPGLTLSLPKPDYENLFLVKYENNGNLTWLRDVTGMNLPFSYYLSADLDDNVYVGGYFAGSLTFKSPSGNKTLIPASIVGRQTYFAKYLSNGNLGWAFTFASICGANFGHKIAIDSKNNVLLGGAFCGLTNFNPSNCKFEVTAKNTTSDGFLAKFNQEYFGSPDITSFSLNEQYEPAQLFTLAKTIRVQVNPGADLTKLRPNITINAGTMTPLSDVEVDLSAPATYSVKYNCVTSDWVVRIVRRFEKFEFCSGSPIKLMAETGRGITYQWQKYNGSAWVIAPGITNMSEYNIAGIDNHGGSDISVNYRAKMTQEGIDFYSSDMELIIHPIPENHVISTPQLLFCSGTANIVITGSDPLTTAPLAFTYRWEEAIDGGAWAILPGASGRDLSPPEFHEPRSFRRVVVSGNCEVTSNTLTVGVYKPTVASAGPTVSFCEVTEVTLQANPTGRNEIGTWTVLSPSDYQPFDASSIHNPTATLRNFPMDKVIKLQWAIENLDCGSTTTSEMEISSYSDINLKSAPKIYLYAGETVSLGVSANLAPDPAYKFEWNDAPGLNSYSILNPNATVIKDTDYRLEASYGLSCLKVLYVRVVVLKDIIPPNAFSPNGDGVNDLWTIKNLEDYPNASILVYNRYGKIVYRSVGFPKPWDGKANGILVPVGTYYYTIKLNDKKNKYYQGDVTVLH